jgi:HAD superfamily phosphatase (TIGR01681 family)
MYEPEVNGPTEPFESLPPEIRKRFSEYRDQIAVRTVLPWGEHCTECVWPVCYTTCELYSPRADGACRQFVDGMVRIDHDDGLNPYLLKIRFRRWAKLWTVGNLDLRPLSVARRQERLNIAVGAIGRAAPLPTSIKVRVLHKINYLRRRSAENAGAGGERPDCFVLECYNPNPGTVALTFSVRLRAHGTPSFQQMLDVASGYNRIAVPFTDIAASVDFTQPFEIEIVPNDAENLTLYFGLMDFVKKPEPSTRTPTQSNTCKCIVWDLDNTLWDGILVEDGPERIQLRQDVVHVIKQMDERGILQSIASKNSHDDALRVLCHHGLDKFFLYPQISWQPKSQSLTHIARSLNIGIDTIAFVDDQSFERQEVKSALPQVILIDARNVAGMLDRPEFRVPVTAESRSRRSMYRQEQNR